MSYQEKELTYKIISSAMEVHKTLGPGLLESVYMSCLCLELKIMGLKFQSEVILPVIYKNRNIGCGYRLDLIIEDKIIVELKSVETLLPLHEAQLLTYLRLSGKEVGLIKF